MNFVRQTYANSRFEVLYPPDVNEPPFNTAINLPVAQWTPAKLDSLKTENFTFTGDRDLNKAGASVMLPLQLGFGPERSAHLVGISDITTPWQKESAMAQGMRAGLCRAVRPRSILPDRLQSGFERQACAQFVYGSVNSLPF